MNHTILASPGSTLVAFGLAIALVGCGAPFSSTSGAGGAGGDAGVGGGSTVTSSSGPSVACSAAAPCGEGFFCLDAACGDKGVTGVCRPVDASATAEPVCGCDGVTYWNSRLGAASSRLVRAEAACTDVATWKRCDEEGTSCRKELGEVCAFPQSTCGNVATDVGTCWAMPPTCSGATTLATRCEGNKTGCENLCEMIMSGKSFRSGSGC